MVRMALLALGLLGGCIVVERDEGPRFYPEFEGAHMRQWWFAHKPLLDLRLGPGP